MPNLDLPALFQGWERQRGQRAFRVVALGSSNTEIGWHSDGHHGWPCWLGCAIRASIGQHVWMINAGISGNTAAQLRSRLPGDVLDLHPHLVIITIGGNDYFQHRPIDVFENDLRMLADTLRAAGSAVVFQTYYAFLPEAGDGLSVYMDAVRSVANSTNAGLIDQYSWFGAWLRKNPTEYRSIMRDPAHLNPIGNALFGMLAARACGVADPVFPADMRDTMQTVERQISQAARVIAERFPPNPDPSEMREIR